jgi:hypothetical protein
MVSIDDIIEFSISAGYSFLGVMAAHFGNMHESIKVGHISKMVWIGRMMYTKKMVRLSTHNFIVAGDYKSAYGVLETVCAFY